MAVRCLTNPQEPDSWAGSALLSGQGERCQFVGFDRLLRCKQGIWFDQTSVFLSLVW